MHKAPRTKNWKGEMLFTKIGLIPFLVMALLTLSTLQAMGSTMDMSAMDNKDCSAQICCSACVSPVPPESPQIVAFDKPVFFESEPLVAFPEKHSILPYHPPR